MFKAGLPLQGLLHDMSKFSPTEFCASAKYWSGNRSPIDNEKDVTGYSLAWQHHKGHNPHHPEYWLENVMNPQEEITPLLMPYKYAVEMICDWVGAGMAYNSGEFNYNEPLEYFVKNNQHKRIHPAIKLFALDVLMTISSEKSFGVINEKVLSEKYKNNCNHYFNNYEQ